MRRRDPSLPPLDVVVGAPLAIGDHVGELVNAARPMLALYIGGMGARNQNFHNNLARRYGYEAEAQHIQDLYLGGQKEAAAATVPQDLLVFRNSPRTPDRRRPRTCRATLA